MLVCVFWRWSTSKVHHHIEKRTRHVKGSGGDVHIDQDPAYTRSNACRITAKCGQPTTKLRVLELWVGCERVELVAVRDCNVGGGTRPMCHENVQSCQCLRSAWVLCIRRDQVSQKLLNRYGLNTLNEYSVCIFLASLVYPRWLIWSGSRQWLAISWIPFNLER